MQVETRADLGDCFRLVGLLCIVCSNALRLDPLSFCIFLLIIFAEKIDVFILRLLGSKLGKGLPRSAGSRQIAVLRSIRFDMSIPSCYMRVCRRIGCR